MSTPGRPELSDGGEAAFSGRNIVFIGLARNCAHSLPRILGWIVEFSADLEDWGYVLLESDSDDDTPAILKSFDELHHRGIVECLPPLRRRIPKRTARISYLRNRALDHLWNDRRLDAFDFAIIMDTDGANETFPREALLAHMTCWPQDRGAVFANQTEAYYDVWAFRHPVLSPDDCWERVRNRRRDGLSRAEARHAFVALRRAPLPSDAGLIEVDSAFGGLGLYRLPAVRGCRYVGLDPQGNMRCEHVEFHRQVRQNGHRLFIDTAMINGTGVVEHSPPKKEAFLHRLWSQISFLR